MSYLIFARKFRPQVFEEVVGQEHITTTLKNAIRKGRIAQSFLFSGSRGVGKTSTARILAKALNCKKGVSGTPCNQCTPCDEISRGISLDVLEIDGASNRGIDEIRTLRENVKFKPSSGQFKIYIIDEVHMLTGEAFNALLKTLEEPPEHVKFIFATTEPHKVPLTILSRCQRFHFKRLSTADIHAKLKEIAKKEKIKAGDKTLFLIAKSAEGSLRDGEGLLDQLASFSEGEIREEDVLFSLGLTSNDTYFQFLHAIAEREGEKIVRLIHDLTEHGKDMEQFLKGLLERFRDLLVLTLGETKEEWIEQHPNRPGSGRSSLSPIDSMIEQHPNRPGSGRSSLSPIDSMIEQDAETAAELKTISKKFGKEELFLVLSLLQQALREIRWSRTPRFLVEICLLKIANRADLASLQEILRELKKPSVGSSGGGHFTPKPPLASGTSPLTPKFEDKKKDRSRKEVSTEEVSPLLDQAENRISSKVNTPTKAVGLNDVEQVWPELLTQVKARRMSIGMFLSEAEPVEVCDNLVVFGFPGEFKFHKETIEQQNNKIFVRDMLRSILKAPVEVTFVVTEAEQVEAKAPVETVPSQDSGMISSALEIFDGSRVIRKT